MSVAIIDYGSGNLRSAAKAFERAGGGRPSIRVTNSPKDIAEASHIVLPGVGAFGDCMQGLSALPGMLDTLREAVLGRGRWFLGICVGMQLLFERGHEHGVHPGLGWLKGEVVGLAPGGGLKIPHMGWNDLRLRNSHPLLKGIDSGAHAYFVHSYHARPVEPGDVAATVEYGEDIAAIVAHNNIMGTQFHPEKSQQTGLALIRNFLAL